MDLATIIKAMIHVNGAMSGYDIAKQLKEKTGHQHQQVYRELAKIEKSGYLVKKVIPQSGKPDKKLYDCAHGGDCFAYAYAQESNFSMSPVAYSLLIGDILNCTDNFDKYVEHMKQAESEFFKE